jgi:ribosomal protein S18 acetylase RimI-like enzyme
LPIRPLKLPDDLDNLYNLIIEAFQYPENPEWNIDSDEVDGIKDTVNTLRQIWPLYRMINWTTPALRDALLGYIWEEECIAVGLVTISRRGSTDSWMVGNVAVLPNFRRRGIARQLVVTALDTIRAKGGDLVVLDVIAGNLPAHKLYESLGFVQYTSALEMELKSAEVPELPTIPEGYHYEVVPPREWRLPMQMAQRTSPYKRPGIRPDHRKTLPPFLDHAPVFQYYEQIATGGRGRFFAQENRDGRSSGNGFHHRPD